MALVTPNQIFPGYTSDGTVINIPVADLAEAGLTPAEANATTGNAMELLRVMVEKYNMSLNALAPTARPSRSTLTKAAPTISSSPGVAPGTLRQVYTLAIDLVPTGLEPAAE